MCFLLSWATLLKKCFVFVRQNPTEQKVDSVGFSWLSVCAVICLFFRLTALVMVTLYQAQPFIFIDENVMNEARKWLECQQRENGCFRVLGKHSTKRKGVIRRQIQCFLERPLLLEAVSFIVCLRRAVWLMKWLTMLSSSLHFWRWESLQMWVSTIIWCAFLFFLKFTFNYH